MTKESIELARIEALKFVARAEALLDETGDSPWPMAGAKTGALRRQSLELTRALAAMRRPG